MAAKGTGPGNEIGRNRGVVDTTARNVRMRQYVEQSGRFVRFALDVFRALPTAIKLYPAEVFRHVGVLIRSNSLVVLFVALMSAAITSITAHYFFVSVGIESYVGAMNGLGALRGLLQVVFGWIIAAKVGCGIVAELGAMRISEEIDAMEVMGVPSIAYLVGTRIVASAIVLPFLWFTAIAVAFITGYAFNSGFLGTVSGGGYIQVLFLFQNNLDILYATIWAFVSGLLIILVACYYGYTAKGGPVGVGGATAKSMLVNLVLVSLVAAALIQVFYGTNANAPIGN